jgi:hypothetical protein
MSRPFEENGPILSNSANPGKPFAKEKPALAVDEGHDAAQEDAYAAGGLRKWGEVIRCVAL